MMDQAQVIAIALRPVFRAGLKIGIEEKVGMLRYMPYRSRTDRKDLFPAAIQVFTVYLGIGDLLQVITVNA